MDDVETEIYSREDKEIPSSVIGELVMDKLKDLEAVAYVRFASVYREFKDVNTFVNELKKMLDSDGKSKSGGKEKPISGKAEKLDVSEVLSGSLCGFHL